MAGTATAVSGRVSRRQQGRWAEQEQQQYAQEPQPAYAAPPPAPAAPAAATGADMDTKLAQLEQLAALKESGVLSEAEFELQKHSILSS